ncbi:MAG TPA: DoxX family membrane protein [Candidatus Paceibacterota bacterium]
MNTKLIDPEENLLHKFNGASWVLRIAVAGEFIGHGVFALQGRKAWVEWFSIFGISDVQTATTLLWLVGLIDVLLAILILVKPIRLALLWMAFWGFWTALMRPIAGDSIFEFVERWANWGAPLALFLVVGWPKTFKEWFR